VKRQREKMRYSNDQLTREGGEVFVKPLKNTAIGQKQEKE